MELLASPRMRRRAAWLAGLAVVASAVAGVVLLSPNQGDYVDKGPRGLGYEPPQPEVPVKRSRSELAQPLSVAARFIDTAVARQDLDESWDIVAPTLKEGYTRAAWAKGAELPVQPFPVSEARWRLEYSFEDTVGLRVALFPPSGSEYRPSVFDIDVKAFGSGKQRRWLVEYFMPAGSAEAGSFGIPRSATGLPNLSPDTNSGESVLGARWLLVPLGILALAVLVPITLGVAYVLRVRRAEKEFAGAPRAP